MSTKILTVFMGLALAAVSAQTAEPTIKYEVNGTNLIVTYSGTLYQSSDAVSWTEVASASSPYVVTLGDKKLFFCAKGEEGPSENITIPLSDTVNLDMIWIEPGTFIMGSPEDELGRGDNETQHAVTLTRGYWLGKYEVTQAQYEAVMGTNPSYFKGADLPVEQVSWNDATNFCAKLTASERAAGRLPVDYEYTLPTEAQWEYACRAGTMTALNSGMDLSNAEECPEMDKVGWYYYNSDSKTHPVGQKQPNAWGLYDMHGNVYEWCLDWYGDYPRSSVIDPTGPDTGDLRVQRGGGRSLRASGCRSAWRSSSISTSRYRIGGFRVALSKSKDITVHLPNDVELDMIWIKPGTFMMGSPEDELGRGRDETQHEVTLTQGYWLGKYEVTQAQYQAIMGTNPSYFKGADLPVEQVSWNDATNFCAKLTARERAAGRLPVGYEYTLPTEAQWEYACRAGTTTALNSGKNLSSEEKCPEMDEVGWYGYNTGEYDSDGKHAGKGKTYSVGQKLPNVWGLYDMHGNVYEWCLDWYGDGNGDYPASSVTDPTGDSTGTVRIVRGGCWGNYAYDCRSADRYSTYPIISGRSLGFRVALAPIRSIDLTNFTVTLPDDVSLEMVGIEPGTFIMGSPENELGRDSNETQHEVTLTKGYWMGKYEVTQAQYEAIMEVNPSHFVYRGANRPVECVSWNDAMEFCAKLTAREKAAGRLPAGYEYTLPTEAQWEYACRAGTTTALNNGKNLSRKDACPEMDEVGWYLLNSDDEETYPVGRKRANFWGLYDMHGNVWEWCLDWYGTYPSSSVTDPTGPSTGSSRVMRGGGWDFYARYNRSAYRDSYSPNGSYYSIGFRVALAPVK